MAIFMPKGELDGKRPWACVRVGKRTLGGEGIRPFVLFDKVPNGKPPFNRKWLSWPQWVFISLLCLDFRV